jgi:hypothetical protein
MACGSYKRHRFTEHGCKRAACVRCGAPNPNWEIVLLVKPARRPSWWPKNGKKGAAWATINWDGEWILGYSIGVDFKKQFRRSQARAARNLWEEEYDFRKWVFREVLGRTSS